MLDFSNSITKVLHMPPKFPPPTTMNDFSLNAILAIFHVFNILRSVNECPILMTAFSLLLHSKYFVDFYVGFGCV